ncbi:OmpA family protein [Shimia sp. R9_2]|uniref:OmpA family protein n=1 Tax=Shimia sp. R9_2 TaxID=2821112 RepID=UPI001ADB7FA9|nr:OmpA family protein [Shimia sp. R9_2]MBO9395870.1 OmpA family protein [Shimia sp. R9_2]
MKTALAIGLAIMAPLACWAFEPQFDGEGQLMADVFEPQGVLTLPVGRFADGVMPTRSLPGNVTRRSWRISRGFRGTGMLTATLAAQMRQQGYDVVFECESDGCGGFDFRFGIDVLPPPKMFVDLSDYFFLSGTKDTDTGLEAVWILVSQTVQAGMVQIESVSPANTVAPEPLAPTGGGGFQGVAEISPDGQEAVSTKSLSDLSAQIEGTGHVVLDDLSFETGASKLAEREFASLKALAAYLKANAETRIALVGHTDSQGALDVNTRISRQRAQAVKDRLVSQHGVPSKQVEARGAGYLAPVASNRTDAGREANRRVEAVLLNITE